MDDLGSPRWAIFPTWLRLRKGGRFLSVIVAPVGALLLLYALGNDPLFAVALLALYAACPGLSALARHDDEVWPTALLHMAALFIGGVFVYGPGFIGRALYFCWSSPRPGRGSASITDRFDRR